MSVFKIEKNDNYTIMSNYHLRDRNLSYKAKGLLSFMLSLPDDWDYSVKGLASISKENMKAIRTTLKELEDNGYLVRERKQLENGRFDYDYLIYEIPYNQKGYAVEGHTEKDTQINTNIINNKKQIDKEDKTKSSFFNADEHNRLTIELIDRKYINEDDINLYYYDNLFNELLEENSYGDLITIIHYILCRLKSNHYLDEDGNEIKNKYGYFKGAIKNNIRLLNFDYSSLWEEWENNL
ncbi:MAG: helix-turn-helix domain-containing protein [bacterium]|nr:helix-turn-helix domain-containing protein [bacterium]